MRHDGRQPQENYCLAPKCLAAAAHVCMPSMPILPFCIFYLGQCYFMIACHLHLGNLAVMNILL